VIEVANMRGDMILSAVLRSDLAPIPYTFEAQVRVTQDTAATFRDNAVITVNSTSFRIIHTEPVQNVGGGPQGKEPINAVSITAYPDDIADVARPRSSAVIFENTSLAAIYRACGANVPIKGDLPVSAFACLIGNIPTFGLSRVLQEESAVVMWRKGTLQSMALRDLVAQVPVDAVDGAESEGVQSEFIVADEVPVYYSIGADGSFVSGPRKNAWQRSEYTPRKSERALNAMGRVLVRRKVITGKVRPTIRAGDVVTVRGTPLVVMTVAQVMKNGTGGDAQQQYTRVWLGGLS
jgi:hypothetical protein